MFSNQGVRCVEWVVTKNPIRIVTCTIWFFVAISALAALSLVPRFRFKISYYFGRWLCPVALWLLAMEVEIRHPERLETGVSHVITPNHQHLYDVFVIPRVIPPRSITIGKKSIRKVPLFGWLFHWTGNLLIDRADNAKAVETMNTATRHIHRHRLSVVILPEGTRSNGRGLLPFKKGAFYLAIDTGLPLLPLVVSSLGRSRRVIVEALEPVVTAGMTREDAPALLEATHARMKAAVAALDAEIKGRA